MMLVLMKVTYLLLESFLARETLERRIRACHERVKSFTNSELKERKGIYLPVKFNMGLIRKSRLASEALSCLLEIAGAESGPSTVEESTLIIQVKGVRSAVTSLSIK